jgi:hypothetical protein
MTPDELNAIKKRCEAATEGPWRFADTHLRSGFFSDHETVCDWGAYAVVGSPARRNQDFIAHAREDVPKLVAEVERLRGKLEYLADGVRGCSHDKGGCVNCMKEVAKQALSGERGECLEAGVPFFLKQMEVDGKLVKMPELDGKVWDQMPTRATQKESEESDG